MSSEVNGKNLHNKGNYACNFVKVLLLTSNFFFNFPRKPQVEFNWIKERETSKQLSFPDTCKSIILSQYTYTIAYTINRGSWKSKEGRDTVNCPPNWTGNVDVQHDYMSNYCKIIVKYDNISYYCNCWLECNLNSLSFFFFSF